MKDFLPIHAVRPALIASRRNFYSFLVFLLVALMPGQLLAGSGIFQGFVVLNSKNTRDIFYDLNPNTQTGNSDFNGVSFGDFKTDETFVLRGGEVNTYKNNLSDVLNGRLHYRVYPAGPPPSNLRFNFINLPYNGELSGTVGDQKWQETNASVNLLAGLAPGSYAVEVYMESDYNDYNTSGPTGSGTNYYSNGGANYVAFFTVSQGSIPLPVTLASFEAKRQDNNAQLIWETASEENSKGYEVQVSTDSHTFRALSFVPSQGAAGTSTGRRSYSYFDTENGKAGVRYYRLRQVDLDGTETFFGPKAVSFSKAGSLVALAVAPNPFASDLTLTVPALEAARIGTVILTDMLGRTALSQSLTLAAGVTQARLPELNNLPKGIYHLRLSLNGEVQTMKLLKE
jgi:hypothetical protein